MQRVVVAHGGTASSPKEKDGTDRAVEAGMRELKRGEGPIEAAVAACVVLEDDERFNAGTGSNFRFDGRTIEMDAAVMDSRRRYGAVSGIQRVKNPVLVARKLMEMPDNILGGLGATRFARTMGMEDHDPATQGARERWQEAIDGILSGEASGSENPWKLETLRERWNYERPFDEVLGNKAERKLPKAARSSAGQETIGAVAYDGITFAAAASTGGTIATLLGRIGDTPNIGAGLYAGEFGAVACSGNGNVLLRERTATKIHQWMGGGDLAEQALRRFVATLSHDTDFFGVAIGRREYAALGNREIAWSARED
ncbi:MAG TPA: isoaspartyl peptidase/L-asparaginase [Candidatus Thermoplasmatota archaeon]|nr:isoaspartyl peptidase/L-asparaginase [Candidatus Thermoplasmatota archaeon]